MKSLHELEPSVWSEKTIWGLILALSGYHAPAKNVGKDEDEVNKRGRPSLRPDSEPHLLTSPSRVCHSHGRARGPTMAA
jgi:hypothetical protein